MQQVYDSRYEDIPEDNIATIKKDREFIASIIMLLEKEKVSIKIIVTVHSIVTLSLLES